MKTSPTGISLIKHFEGLRLSPYQDVAGVWTVGYGHIRWAKAFHEAGETITEDDADHFLAWDLEDAEEEVTALLPSGRFIWQGAFDALVSFTFNLGATALQHSTMLKLIKSGDMKAAADEFLKWDHAGGKEVGGLLKRREAERALFLS